MQCSKGDHSPRKPGKVTELQSSQRKVRENGEKLGKPKSVFAACDGKEIA